MLPTSSPTAYRAMRIPTTGFDVRCSMVQLRGAAARQGLAKARPIHPIRSKGLTSSPSVPLDVGVLLAPTEVKAAKVGST